jgi:hypothetical protein
MIQEYDHIHYYRSLNFVTEPESFLLAQNQRVTEYGKLPATEVYESFYLKTNETYGLQRNIYPL